MQPIKTFDFDNLLIEKARSEKKTQVSIYKIPETIVVLGKSSKIDIELNYPAVLEKQIDIYRRAGGGCSVVIDPGNLIISVVIPVPGITTAKKYFRLMNDWIIEGLEKAGVRGVEKAGSSDLAIENYKISGSCIYGTKDYIYFSSSLLVSAEIDEIGELLKYPPREPQYRAGRSHKDFVTNISQHSGYKSSKELLFKIDRILTADSLDEKIKGQI